MGMGIGDFIRHAKDSGGSRAGWLEKWKDDKRVTVFLHTAAEVGSSYNHPFMMLDVGEDDGGNQKQFMRYPRFVSPDPEPVHRSQFFRDDATGQLRVPPDRDPFLLLREWLRTSAADHIGLEDPVFEWVDPKRRETKTWLRGEISGLVKRGNHNYFNSLDTKLEYIFVVVDVGDPTQVLLARETKLLGQRVGEVIRQQKESLGVEKGDPLIHPYAFTWEYDPKAKSPMDSYKAFRNDGAELTDEIWELITSQDFPDPDEFCSPRDGDMEKIRAAFEAAAQVDLPLDEIFSDDPQVRRELIGVGGGRRAASRAQQASASAAARQVQRPAQTRPADRQAAMTQAASQAAPAAVQAGGVRRKKVDKPAPPPEETIPCDDCQEPMSPTATECTKCGAKYEIDAPESKAAPAKTAQARPAKPAQEVAPAARKAPAAKPAQQGKATPAGGRPAPQRPGKAAAQEEPGAAEAADQADAATRAPWRPESPGDCFSCGEAVRDGTCTNCGLNQGDDIPF